MANHITQGTAIQEDSELLTTHAVHSVAPIKTTQLFVRQAMAVFYPVDLQVTFTARKGFGAVILKTRHL